MRTLLLGVALSTALSPALAASTTPVAGADAQPPRASPDSAVSEKRRVAAQLWKLGLGYFASGEMELARVEWFACAGLDASNENCRQGLEGLKRLMSSPPIAAVPAPAAPAAAAKESPSAEADPQEAALRAKAQAQRRDRHSIELQVQAAAAVAHGETQRARDLYSACRALAPRNSECAEGLARLDERKATEALPAAPASGAQLLAGAKDAVSSSDEARRQAIRHWNAGINQFQKGDFSAARQEWVLCQQADPANLDCQTGLQRIDASGGGR